jgi:8-oxo-dGTP diphosphatase
MNTQTPVTRPSDQHPDAYDASKYPSIFVTVDLAVFTIRNGVLSVLLIERGDEPFQGCWALPGGFVGPDEDAETAAWRELAEETGVGNDRFHLEQLKTYTRPDRDPRHRIVSVAHVAFAPNLPEPTAGSDARTARWWAVEDVAASAEDAPVLAFDHAEILTDALERVRSKLEYTTLALQFAERPYTMGDIHRIYAAVWSTAPDRGNLTRKFLKTDGAVVPTDERRDSASTGPKPLLFVPGPATMLNPPMMRPETTP